MKNLFSILLTLLISLYGLGQNKIVGYQYAFNDGVNLTYVPITPTTDFHLQTDFDVSSLTHTINQLHIRFKDANGLWSGIVNQMFIHNPQTGGAQDLKIVAYEYYFNDDTGNRHYTTINPQDDFNLISDIDVSQLTNTINQIHFRFKDSSGQWSSVINKMFIHNPQTGGAQDLKIVAYEYYFNDDTGNRHYTTINPQDDFNLISDIDVSQLTNTINQIHFRFKDSSGQWSSVINKMFIHNPQTGGAQDLKIVAYEYFFNDDTGNRHYTTINPQDDFNLVTDIDVSQLNHALNQIHFRFKDNSGQWSSMVSQMFLINPESDTIANNKMVSYEYWVDSDMNSMKSIAIQPNVPDLNVIDLDLNHIWRGQHVLHSRYLDTNGLYSLVTTDTITKASRPLARFTTSATEICEGESIQFDDNNSVDYDTYVWDFGDGTTATGLHETHTYPNAGNYTVTLTVTDTNTNVSDVMQENITVNALPDDTVSMTGNNPACFGDIVTLSANASGMNYLWNTGETTQSIDVTTAGTYSVTVTNPQTSCQSTSDDIIVDFYPEINNQVSIQNNPVELIADQANATYQWLDCNQNFAAIPGETQQNFIPSQSGNYAVAISMNNCQVISDCYAVTVVGITDNTLDDKLKIYPNPADEQITIKLLKNNPLKITIINSEGQILSRYHFDKTINSINISNLKSGIYILKIRFLSGHYQNKQYYLKFIRK